MTSGKNKTLEYDVENRIIRITQPDVVTSFMYDGDGGRVRVSRTANNETRTTTYIGSLFEKNDCTDSGSQITQIKHIFAGATRVCSVKSVDGGPLTMDYYHGDHLGSSSIITDQNGQQVQYLEYAPYGTVARNEGTDATAYKFTGKELDSTGLYFYSARYYDPEIGRFVTADTIVQAPYDPQSLNRYAYCRNNPIKYVDPSGHWFWAFLGLIGIVAGIGAVASTVIAGVTGQITSWSTFWAAFASGATAGAVAAVGSFVTGAGTILGGLLIGAAAGGAGGAVGSSIAGGFSWGAVGLGAAFGGALGGFGNSSAGRAVGRAIGKGIGKLPFGQHIQNFGCAIGDKINQLHAEARGINIQVRAVDSATEDFLNTPVETDTNQPTGYRYVGPDEAAKIAEIGKVPNVSRSGISKNVFYTPEEPLFSAFQAKDFYNLKELPTHRIGLNTAKTTNIYGGNVDGGTGIELVTGEEIPVVDIQELGK
jgi:RHS repeat-associated protein